MPRVPALATTIVAVAVAAAARPVAAQEDGAAIGEAPGDRAAPEPAGPPGCVDAEIRDQLNARRRYRGVRPRLFRKGGRHELSVMGGIYAADLYDASWLVQGTYAYHFDEDLGLELGFAYTRAEAENVRIVEDALDVALLDQDRDVLVYQAHLLWSVAYGKLRWLGSGISRFDLFLAIGGGFTDTESARGLTLSAGIGLKLYFTEWFAVRFDVRDQILEQELLGESRLVQNVAVTLGLSVFLPPSSP